MGFLKKLCAMEIGPYIFGRKVLWILLLSVSSFCFLFIFFDFPITNFSALRMFTMNNGFKPVNNDTKTILFWNTMFGDETFYFGRGDIFYDCPVRNCYATRDRTYTDLENFDAIVFHSNELWTNNLPDKRSPKQSYVFANLESAYNRPLSHPIFEDYFNLTMTYRLDSDVVWSYGVIKDLHNGSVVAPSLNVHWDSTFNDTSTGKFLWKKKSVAWVVSNCEADSGRLNYVKELSKYIDVTIYGGCGDRYTCPKGVNCFEKIIEANYYFYLSFENSLCQDYVTEKLYNPLRYEVVPIVYGGGNYTRYAPPFSYVNALDFDSPKDLAKYLYTLIRNPRKYRRYFQWKERYRVDQDGGNRRAICSLCELLHRRKGTKIYSPMTAWYSLDQCPMQNLIHTLGYATKSVAKLLS